ncbi:MAG: phage recombination protein Bet [Armatimonadota bacterium]
MTRGLASPVRLAYKCGHQVVQTMHGCLDALRLRQALGLDGECPACQSLSPADRALIAAHRRRMVPYDRAVLAGDGELPPRPEIDEMTQHALARQEAALAQQSQQAPTRAVAPVEFTEEQLRVITETVAKDCSPLELQLFLHTAKRTGLDPLLKQIYALKLDGRLTIHTGIDGVRLIAERTGRYRGVSAPEWCGEDGVWKDIWLSETPPAAARVYVYRSDCAQGIPGVVMWREFVRKTKDGHVMKMWREKPAHMLSKCAEMNAFKKAFPAETQDLAIDVEEPAPREVYVREERESAGDRRALAATQAGETQANYGAATGARGSQCPECHAPADRPHTRTCSRREGGELELKPPGPGRPASEERRAQMRRMFAAYAAADGPDGDDELMRRHCSAVLSRSEGVPMEVTSRSSLTTEQLATCADYFERHGLPLLDDGPVEDNPFED